MNELIFLAGTKDQLNEYKLRRFLVQGESLSAGEPKCKTHTFHGLSRKEVLKGTTNLTGDFYDQVVGGGLRVQVGNLG